MKWTDLTADGSPLAPGMRDPAQLDICAYAGRCAPGFLAAHTDDRFPDYVLFESQNDAHFATADRGRTFFPVDLGAGAVLSSVRLHPAAAGRVLAHVVRLDRAYVRQDDTVWVMDGDELRIRKVDVAFADSRHAFVRAGLEAGDKVVTTSLATVVDGLPIREQGAAR